MISVISLIFQNQTFKPTAQLSLSLLTQWQENWKYLKSRGRLLADFPFQYSASVKPWQFQDTEKKFVLVHSQLNKTGSKMRENKTFTVLPKEIAIEVLKYTIWDNCFIFLQIWGLYSIELVSIQRYQCYRPWNTEKEVNLKKSWSFILHFCRLLSFVNYYDFLFNFDAQVLCFRLKSTSHTKPQIHFLQFLDKIKKN